MADSTQKQACHGDTDHDTEFDAVDGPHLGHLCAQSRCRSVGRERPKSVKVSRTPAAEHDVEVRHRQQLGLARRQPLAGRRAPALRAMPVAAGVVGDVLMGALFRSVRRGRRGRSGVHGIGSSP